MRIVPIKEALGMDAGETVPSIRGRITKVDTVMNGKRDNPKEGENPSWSFQKLTVNDGTGQIVVKVWDRDPFSPAIQGQEWCFACNEGTKGLTGLKIEVYRNEKLIKTSGTAHIDPVDGGGSAPQSGGNGQGATNTPPQQQNAPAATGTQNNGAKNGNGHSNGNGSAGDTAAVKKQLNRMANLYLHCMYAAEYVQGVWEASGGKDGGRVMPVEQFQACVSSLFIQACKTAVDGMTPGGQFKAE